MNLVMEASDLRPVVSFPQNIKTVTAATIMKGPEDYTAGLQVPFLILSYLNSLASFLRRLSTCALTTSATQNPELPGSREVAG